MKSSKVKKSKKYKKFDQINGKHSLQQDVDDFCVNYEVRLREGGRVAFFNFPLAKEMGLISDCHSHELNPDLKKKLLQTFGLVIINEYDQQQGEQFPEKLIKKNKYMATRYLQLQHENKIGTNSGDGRSIWNGLYQSKNATWDISSTGTGATCLSPATSKFKKFFQTGDPSISYGCGYSEMQEGLETLFFSEVMYNNQFATERILVLIEYEGQLSINVRAGKNLLRPSHFFVHLKQGKINPLRQLTEHYIRRQIENQVWTGVPKQKKKSYDYFLEKVTECFARITADFEDHYIFCWLDWDGDNILADGSIIDYGSVRQFGLFHSEYRFDDDDRFSTTLTEQKKKARYIVQSYAQMVDFLKTGEKACIKNFVKHECLDYFEQIYIQRKRENILKQIGLPTENIETFIKKHSLLVDRFRSDYHYFEKIKSYDGVVEVDDGITCNAVFCMRDILRELPQLFMNEIEFLSGEDFIDIIKSHYANKRDLELFPHRRFKVKSFQENYLNLLKKFALFTDVPLEEVLFNVNLRSAVINRYDRVTGNSVSIIAEKINSELSDLRPEEVGLILERFTQYQNFEPKNVVPIKTIKERKKQIKGKSKEAMEFIVETVKLYREGL
jgi:hypothetical protein